MGELVGLHDAYRREVASWKIRHLVEQTSKVFEPFRVWADGFDQTCNHHSEVVWLFWTVPIVNL